MTPLGGSWIECTAACLTSKPHAVTSGPESSCMFLLQQICCLIWLTGKTSFAKRGPVVTLELHLLRPSLPVGAAAAVAAVATADATVVSAAAEAATVAAADAAAVAGGCAGAAFAAARSGGVARPGTTANHQDAHASACLTHCWPKVPVYEKTSQRKVQGLLVAWPWIVSIYGVHACRSPKCCVWSNGVISTCVLCVLVLTNTTTLTCKMTKSSLLLATAMFVKQRPLLFCLGSLICLGTYSIFKSKMVTTSSGPHM